jgi:uncharacterized membrane protein
MRSRLPIFILALALIGIGVSSYLVYVHYTQTTAICFGGSAGCETVQNSPYSKVAGIPVALLGLVGYATLALATVWRLRAGDSIRAWLSLAVFLFSLVGVLYSGYLTYLELYVIYAICQWCVVSALNMLIIGVLSFFDLRRTLYA